MTGMQDIRIVSKHHSEIVYVRDRLSIYYDTSTHIVLDAPSPWS